MTSFGIVRALRYRLLILLSALALAALAPVPARAQITDPRYLLGTYLGGPQSDYGRAVAVDAQGFIYLAGDTFSSTFSGFDLPRSGGRDVLLLKLSPDGKEILAGSVVGSPADDEVIAMAITPQGEAVLSIMPSGVWPTQNAINTQPLSGNDGMLVKFDTNLDTVFSTYANMHMSNSGGQNLALDGAGNIYLTGQRYDGSRDLIVQKYSPDGQRLHYERIWRWDDDITMESGLGIEVRADGTAAVTGVVWGDDSTFPVTANAVQKTCGRQLALGAEKSCDEDAFVVILAPDGSTRYASYLGGNGVDNGVDIAVDGLGGTVVVGTTFATDFPTTEGSLMARCQSPDSCYYDTFVTRLDPNGSIAYSTYLNSNDASSMEFSAQVVADASGNATVLGYTSGEHFPVLRPLQDALAATPCFESAFTRFCYDSFITTFSPSGAVRFSTYLGGDGDENPQALALAPDGTLYVTGSTASRSFPVTPDAPQISPSGGNDFFLAQVQLGEALPLPALVHTAYLPLIRR